MKYKKRSLFLLNLGSEVILSLLLWYSLAVSTARFGFFEPKNEVGDGRGIRR